MCQRIAKTSHQLKKLGRWFQIFLNFHTEPWGNDPIWRAFFSNGLVQPPTRKLFSNYLILGVSLNAGTPKSSIVIGISMINHPFWGTPIFGNTHFRVVINYYKLALPDREKPRASQGFVAWLFAELRAWNRLHNAIWTFEGPLRKPMLQCMVYLTYLWPKCMAYR